MKDDTLYLEHIKDAIEKVQRYIANVNYEEFVSNEMMVDAVVRELEIIGEATNNLSNDFCKNHPEIPFQDIIDMRNILIHNYFGVNKEIVWDTCRKDMPELKKFIANVLE